MGDRTELDGTAEKLWLNRISGFFVDRSPLDPAPAIFLTVGSIPYLLTAVFLALAGFDLRDTFLIGHLLAVTMVAVAPILVWRYETVVFPTFIDRAAEVTPYDDNRELSAIAERYRTFFGDVRTLTAVWVALLVVAVLANDGYFRSLGVAGYTDPAYLVYVLLVTWAGAVTATGVQMAITTNLCIREVGALNFTIDPLHPDGLGGLSTIGYFAIRTTTMISIGALGLPLAFDIARIGGFSGIVYLLVAIYIALVVGSFVFPTVFINRRANDIKRGLLNDKRERIHELRTRLLENNDSEEMEKLQIKLDELRAEYDAYDRVKLYPMSLSIASRLVSSVFLPVFFVLLETYLV